MKNKVIVAGRNYCNILTTARALGEAGYEVEALKIFKAKPSPLKLLRRMKPEAKSKYVSRYSEAVTNGDTAVVAKTLISMAERCEGALVVPVDDYACCAVDEALDELKKHYALPSVGGEQGRLSALMDKSKQKELASESELPMLQSVLIKSQNGSFELDEGIKYPCFIKPNVSMLSTKDTMRKCNSEAELSSALEKQALKGDFEFLCEEFADIKNEYSLLGISTGERAFCGGVFRAVEGGHRERKGVAVTGELVSPEGFEDIIEKCNRYVEKIGYKGLFDIDLIEDKNGKIYFVELNFRAGASTYVLNKAGLNLYGIMADYMLGGKSVEGIEPVCESLGFISEKVLMEEYARGDISLGKARRLMKTAEVFFVKSEEDPKPFRYFKKFFLASAMLKILYKAKSKK